MPQSSRYLSPFLLTCILCLGNSCQDKPRSGKLPSSGSFCFQPEQNLNYSFIHIEFNKGLAKGHIYRIENWKGKVAYDFEATILNDSVWQVTIAYELAGEQAQRNKTTELWSVRFDKDRLWLRGFMGFEQNLEFSTVNCDQLKDIKEYKSLEEIAASDKIAEADQTPWICYLSIPPSAYKRITLREWVQVWLQTDSTFKGRGYGEEEGGDSWRFTFTGTILDDTVYLARVTYKTDNMENDASRTDSERWVLDPVSQRLRLFGNDRPQAGREYAQINCEGMNEYEKKNLGRIQAEQ